MRFEIKFAYPPREESRVVVWVQALREGFRIAYPQRRVHNVYFDTPDLIAFDENLAGISRRCKIRYRWYGDNPRPDVGRLELKNKHASLGWKEAFDIDSPPYEAGDTWRDVRRKLRTALPPAARLVFDEYDQTALINEYTRRYYESRDHSIRITLDSEQAMFDQLTTSHPNLTRRVNLPDVNILEMKCDAEHRDAATRVLATCPVRASRFSKYTVGSELR